MPKAQDLRQSVAFIIETLEMRNYLSTTLYYDANGSAAGVGGSGVWDHTSALWNTAADGSGNQVAWDGVSGVKSAVFGGVFGQVAIQSDVVVDSLSIQTPGYKIIGDHTLMFGSTGSITTAAGVDLRLSTKLSGSITISGDGVNAIILTRDVGRDNTNPSITVANGSLLRLSATQHLNALTLDAGAAARINQGGAKALVLNTLHIAGTLTIPTATLDVEDNAMIVTDANAAAQVFGWMVAGFGTGDWTGHGITSTIAANDPNGLLALGYANNIDLSASQFAGITLGNNDTIVKFTYYGDADLDGVVTLEDFSQFLYGYQQGGTPNWIDGDFDYSGTVTLEDFSLFLANHNTTPATTPTYAIDGLDQTFTAGEEVTLSPRITNNIPLPAGTVFGWTVKQGNTVLFTSTGADFAYKLDENIAPTTLEVDLCVNNDEDHIISKTMDVDTPAGWTQVYTTFDYEITTDVDDFGGIETVYNGVSTNWSEGIEGSGQIYYTPLHGDKTITLHLDHLPKHAYLNASGGLVINHQNYPEGSRMKTYVDGELVNDQLIDGTMDGLLVSRILPHTKSSATVTIVVTGLTSSDTWWVDAGVNTFLPTVTLDVNQSSTIEGQDFVLTATRTTPFTEAELNAMTPEEKAEMLPQMNVTLDWSGDAMLDPTQSYLPGYVTIPAGEVSGDEYVYIGDDTESEVTRELSVEISRDTDRQSTGDPTPPYIPEPGDRETEIITEDYIPGTYIDEDTLQEVSIAPGDEEQAYEEDANSATPRDGLITVSREGEIGMDQPLKVFYQPYLAGEPNDATPFDDYVVSSVGGGIEDGVRYVIIPAGLKSVTIKVHAIDDTIEEQTEVASIQLLQNPTGGIPTYSIEDAAKSAFVGIVSDDHTVPAGDFKIIAAGIDYGGQGVKRDVESPSETYDQNWAGLDWSDSDGDGVAKAGEAEFPVSYRRSIGTDKVYLKAKPIFWVQGSFDPNADWYIVGDNQGVEGADEFNPSAKATITQLDPKTYKITQGEITSSKELDEVIKNDDLAVKWRLEKRVGQEITKRDYAETHNKLYVTGAEALDQYHTVLDIGCRNAKEKNPVTQKDEVIASIWSDFENSVTTGLKAADDAPMVYWGKISQDWYNRLGNDSTVSLIRYHDGQCGAWARLLVDVLKTQGILNAKLFIITSRKDQALRTGGNALVNNGIIPVGFSVDSTGFIIKQSAKGQGGNNEMRRFFDHAVVRIDGISTIFDPSYGKMFNASSAGLSPEAVWEEESVETFLYDYKWSGPGRNNTDYQDKINGIEEPNNDKTKHRIELNEEKKK